EDGIRDLIVTGVQTCALPISRLISVANRAETRNQTQPIGKENEDEYRREKPKCFFHQVMPDYSLQEIVQALHHPFPEILRPARRSEERRVGKECSAQSGEDR